MDRRTFVLTTGAALVLPAPLLAASGKKYKPGMIAKALADGKTVFADFYTDWCTTCRAQGRAIKALRKANPAYDAAMTFIAVDWDKYSTSEIAKALSIPRRSTLVVLKMRADKSSFLSERLVAETSPDRIKALMDKGLEFAASA